MTPIECRVCGIPAQIEVTHAVYVKGSTSRDCMSAAEWYGGWDDVEYEVLDRKGYTAQWLQRKLDQDKAEQARLDEVVVQALDWYRKN